LQRKSRRALTKRENRAPERHLRFNFEAQKNESCTSTKHLRRTETEKETRKNYHKGSAVSCADSRFKTPEKGKKRRKEADVIMDLQSCGDQRIIGDGKGGHQYTVMKGDHLESLKKIDPRKPNGGKKNEGGTREGLAGLCGLQSTILTHW